MKPWFLALSILSAAAAWAVDEPTGVIVDASCLPIERARFPKVCSEQGTMLYPPEKLCSDPNYQGFEGYKPTLGEARGDKTKVGERPLVLKPLGLKPGDAFHGSVVVGKDDAEALERLNARFGLLDKDRLVIVIGQGVVATAPKADAADVKPEAEVTVTFSKPLAPDCTHNPALLSITDPSGATIGGRLAYREETKTLCFQPSSPWTKGTKYTVRCSRLLEADGGGGLDADFVFSFTIGSGEPHADGGPDGHHDSPAGSGTSQSRDVAG
jgi:hypothetical protein